MNAIAGMDGERDRALRGRGSRTPVPYAGIGVQHELARLPRAELGETRDEPAELVVRHGDDHELAAPHHLERVEHRDAGQHRLDAGVVGAVA